MKIGIIVFLIITVTNFTSSQTYGWYTQTTFNNISLSGIDIVNNNTIWISGNNQGNAIIFKSTNGGLNWNTIASLPGFTPVGQFFLNNLTGWVCGNIDIFASIYKTTNGGLNWTTEAVSENPFTFVNVVKFLNDNIGFTAGSNPNHYKSTNGGTNWAVMPGIIEDIYDIFFINQSTGWMAGGYETGYIYKTTNAGLNWSQITSPSKVFYSICFYNENTGWGCGTDGQVHGTFEKTTDGGANWSTTYLSSMQSAKGISSVDSLTIRFGGFGNDNYGYIFKTTTGGAPFDVEYSDPQHTIWQIVFSGSNSGWALCSNGKVLKYGDITGIENNSELPGYYWLEQNYPNPFNPETKIDFSLTVSDNAEIDVYDITGKLITTIIKEYKSAGNYSVRFDGSNLSSGIYFYRMQTGDFLSTKKMILLK